MAAPVATIADKSAQTNQWFKVGPWIAYSDADGDPAIRYQFFDGGTLANSGYFWTPENTHWAAGTTIEVDAAYLDDVWVRGGTVGGSETLWVRAFDGTGWGNWDSFTFTTQPNTAPVATINDQSVLHDTWSRVNGWLNYSDANGNPAARYQFFDGGTAANGAYFWTPDNAHWAAATTIEVDAAALGDVWVRSGSVGGSETLWVRAFDGTDWGNWDSFTFTTVPNTAPVATINDQSVLHDTYFRVNGWLNYSDANGDPAVRYQFWDSGTAANSGYFWTPDNTHWAANTVIDVDAAALADVWVRGGSAAGSETMWVRAFDGINWGNWDSFTFTTQPNTAPVATINDQSVLHDTWVRVNSLLSYSDANGDPAARYQFWDSGTAANSGYFWTPGNTHWAANTVIEVEAGALADTWVRGGSAGGSETMWVRAFDGANWGNWDSFTFTTVPNTAPVATINNQSLAQNQWSQVTGWLNYSDANGDPAARYQFWDSGTGANSGYFWTPDNTHWAANTAVEVSADHLSDFWIRGGLAGGSETMWVRAFDGTDWGNWDSFTLTTT